jgi:hypothetical protein
MRNQSKIATQVTIVLGESGAWMTRDQIHKARAVKWDCVAPSQGVGATGAALHSLLSEGVVEKGQAENFAAIWRLSTSDPDDAA